MEIYSAPRYKNTVNGQIQGFHLTLSEIMKFFKKKPAHRDFKELLDIVKCEYNYEFFGNEELIIRGLLRQECNNRSISDMKKLDRKTLPDLE